MSSYLTFVYQGYLISLIKLYMYAVFKLRYWLNFYQSYKRKNLFLLISLVKPASIFIRHLSVVFFLIRQPPALPHRLQCSTIGRLRLNRRVRDGNGCFPQAHRHQKSRVLNVFYCLGIKGTRKFRSLDSMTHSVLSSSSSEQSSY